MIDLAKLREWAVSHNPQDPPFRGVQRTILELLDRLEAERCADCAPNVVPGGPNCKGCTVGRYQQVVDRLIKKATTSTSARLIGDLPRRFELYRRQPPAGHIEGSYANAPDEVQLQGVVFADGSVAIRWLTPLRSTSIWKDFETFDKVHGHPEYESELVWLD